LRRRAAAVLVEVVAGAGDGAGEGGFVAGEAGEGAGIGGVVSEGGAEADDGIEGFVGLVEGGAGVGEGDFEGSGFGGVEAFVTPGGGGDAEDAGELVLVGGVEEAGEGLEVLFVGLGGFAGEAADGRGGDAVGEGVEGGAGFAGGGLLAGTLLPVDGAGGAAGVRRHWW
jgi:hypothetical protein